MATTETTTEIRAILVDGPTAARMLDVSEKTLYNLRIAGKVRSVTIGTSRKYRIVDLEAYAASLLEPAEQHNGQH